MKKSLHVYAALLFFLGLLLADNSAGAPSNMMGVQPCGTSSSLQTCKDLKPYQVVTSSQLESGEIAGAEVRNGGSLSLCGISTGNIVVLPGGNLLVTGIVNGAVINRGGHVEIEGTVQQLQAESGSTFVGGILGAVSGSGVVTFKKDAVVGRVRVK